MNVICNLNKTNGGGMYQDHVPYDLNFKMKILYNKLSFVGFNK